MGAQGAGMKGITFNTFGRGQWTTINALMEEADFACLQECTRVSASFVEYERSDQTIRYTNSSGNTPGEMNAEIPVSGRTRAQSLPNELWAIHREWTTEKTLVRRSPRKATRLVAARHKERLIKTVDNYRCSMAILTKQEPIDVHEIPPPAGQHVLQRPIVGVEIQVEDKPLFVFNVHAPANNYLAKVYMGIQLRAIRALVSGIHASREMQPHEPLRWICGGDFNLPPHEMNEVINQATERLVRTDGPTHGHGGVKDYFIVNDRAWGCGAFHATQFGFNTGGSDHWPIIFSTESPNGGGVSVDWAGEQARLEEERVQASADRAAKAMKRKLRTKGAVAVKPRVRGAGVRLEADDDDDQIGTGKGGKPKVGPARVLSGIKRRGNWPQGR